MKKLFTKLTSTAVSALIAVSSFSIFSFKTVADEVKSVTIHFDMSEEGVKVEDDQYGNPQRIPDFSGKPGGSRHLSSVRLERTGYTFQGWTFDGIQGYTPGSVVQFPDEDATMTPVWSKNSDSKKYTVHYEAVCNTGVIDKDGRLPDSTAKAGELVTVSYDAFYHPENSFTQIGWIYDGRAFLGQQNIIMPDHDIELTPNWLKYRNFTYSVGDVDRVIGVVRQDLERIATLNTDLAEAGRFSRIGFRNTGWLCSADGIVYAPESSYLMPDEDVVFTCVWEPITYTLVFRPFIGKEDNIIRIDGKTDTTVVCPDINVKNPGYTFGGWDYKGTVYQPGDEFLIYGEVSGLGIPLEAVWIKNDEPDPAKTFYGDANCDGEIRLSDAILIMQAIGNPDAYGLGGSEPTAITKQGLINADCCNPGDGLTSLDSITVQQHCLEILTELPVNYAQ